MGLTRGYIEFVQGKQLLAANVRDHVGPFRRAAPCIFVAESFAIKKKHK